EEGGGGGGGGDAARVGGGGGGGGGGPVGAGGGGAGQLGERPPVDAIEDGAKLGGRRRMRRVGVGHRLAPEQPVERLGDQLGVAGRPAPGPLQGRPILGVRPVADPPGDAGKAPRRDPG